MYLPYSKHLHIATAGLNVWFGRTRARGRLEPLDFEVEDEAALRLGSGTLTDMTWKQMLDTMSCTECGRCQDVCPAWATGKALSPKLLIMGLRDRLFEEGPVVLAGGEATALVPGAVTDDVVWDCVTCGACVHECPVSIEHVDHIVDLRRHLVMVESRFPTEAGTMLRDVGRSANPWAKPQGERASWADGLDVRVLEPGDAPPEILYWVGCAASFDERARATARATASLLLRAGLDVAILGPRESCTGDPARRMGDEYTFQAQAQQNVATLGEAGVTRVVTSCPHCFNTLGNEYADFGGRYEVVHHTELLAELLRDGRLEAPAGMDEITYHDSCYLARHNDVVAAPREIVSRIGKPLEMARSGKRTFCCGAGGAHMWMEERGAAINEERVREATATGASTLAVACPFCTMMLDDGVKQTGSPLRVADVSVLLAEAIDEAAGRGVDSYGGTRVPRYEPGHAIHRSRGAGSRPRPRDAGPADRRRALRPARASEEHHVAPRRCARAPGAHPARRRRHAPRPGRGAPALRTSRDGRCGARRPRRRGTRPPRAGERRDDQHRRAVARRRRAPRPARQPPLPRLDELGRAPRPRARIRAREGLLRLRRAARARAGRWSRSRRRRVRAADALGLDEVRARGYATAVEELEPGLWAAAAPVCDATGVVVAALSISGPTVRLRRGLLQRFGRLLVAEAREVSALLGHHDRERGVA